MWWSKPFVFLEILTEGFALFISEKMIKFGVEICCQKCLSSALVARMLRVNIYGVQCASNIKKRLQ